MVAALLPFDSPPKGTMGLRVVSRYAEMSEAGVKYPQDPARLAIRTLL